MIVPAGALISRVDSSVKPAISRASGTGVPSAGLGETADVLASWLGPVDRVSGEASAATLAARRARLAAGSAVDPEAVARVGVLVKSGVVPLRLVEGLEWAAAVADPVLELAAPVAGAGEPPATVSFCSCFLFAC